MKCLTAIVAVALVAGGCGQSGPLELPRPPAKPPDVSSGAPARPAQRKPASAEGADAAATPAPGRTVPQ